MITQHNLKTVTYCIVWSVAGHLNRDSRFKFEKIFKPMTKVSEEEDLFLLYEHNMPLLPPGDPVLYSQIYVNTKETSQLDNFL